MISNCRVGVCGITDPIQYPLARMAIANFRPSVVNVRLALRAARMSSLVRLGATTPMYRLLPQFGLWVSELCDEATCHPLVRLSRYNDAGLVGSSRRYM